jgi:hypothetical protein
LTVLVQQSNAFRIHGCAANHLRGTDDVATRGTSRTVTGQDGGREAGEQLRHRNQKLSDVGRIAFDTFEWGCPVEAKLAAASAPERLKARAGLEPHADLVRERTYIKTAGADDMKRQKVGL